MKKIKTLLLATTLIVFGFLLGACGSNVNAEQTYPLKIWKQNENGKMETFELYSNSVGAAITPRLNADGTLYTSK